MTAVLERGPAADSFAHEAFFYATASQFLARTVPYVRQGLAQRDAVVVAASGRELRLLRHALADRLDEITVVDTAEVGVNPARMLAHWESVVAECASTGRRVRAIGQAALPGRSREDELAETLMLELSLNEAFAGGPDWQLLCPYRESFVPGPGRRAQVERIHGGPAGRAELQRSLGEPLPPVPDRARSTPYRFANLHDVREMVVEVALGCGVSAERAEDLRLAASELATNSIRYGGSAGTVRLWCEPDAMVLQFEDGGQLDDPMAGRRRPPVGRPGGRGLFLVNQVCDFVQLRSSGSGTTVRVTTLLPKRPTGGKPDRGVTRCPGPGAAPVGVPPRRTAGVAS